MYSRTKKWAKYRLSIKNTPEDKFPKPNLVSGKSGKVDTFVLTNEGSGDNIDGKRRKNGPYEIYARRKRNVLIGKFIVLALAIAFLISLYFFFVKG